MANLKRAAIQIPNINRPHVVILGAGASLAAFPNGDKNGRKLPLMWNIVEVVGLKPMLDEAAITENLDDFEKLYSNLVVAGGNEVVIAKIDFAIFEYFASLELPDEPTLYDHLVLSLRSKDVIATFNWDPFLVQAMVRNSGQCRPPETIFLHGNAAIGYCMRHKPATVGRRGCLCSRCLLLLENSRLLYPVGQKNYNSDSSVEESWKSIRHYLAIAEIVTVFGYSAPVTDVEALGLLSTGWGNSLDRSREEFEIIDLKDEDELVVTWDNFIHTHHYRVSKDFYSSIIGLSPRRSCEAMWAQNMGTIFIETNPIPQHCSWDCLKDFYAILLADECDYDGAG